MPFKYDKFLRKGKDAESVDIPGLTAAIEHKQDKMDYTTDDSSSDVTIAVLGGTHYDFLQPLSGLTIASVQNSHNESEIQFTGGTAVDVDIPVSVSVIGEPSFEAGKSYIINIRDNMLVSAEYTPGQ